MIVVVTGATGNVGSRVVAHLVGEGHQVRGVARRPPGGAAGAVEWFDIDLTAGGARRRLLTAFEGADAVVHTAWGFQPLRRPGYLHRLDVGGTSDVLAAATETGVAHLVHLSSIGAYSPGRDATPVGEDWPTDGTPWLPYSSDKVAAERLLDAHEAVPGHRPTVARVRPSLVVREDAGGALDRYVLPSLLPSRLLGWLPVLPLDRRFRVQLVHTDDVARAVVAMLDTRATGPFNVAADPVLRRSDVAAALGVPAVHLPWGVLRWLAAAAWAARLQPVDPGWLDMARTVPVISSARARGELGWQPTHDAREVLREALAGMTRGVGADTPSLRPRRWGEQLDHLVRHGPVSRRPRA